MKNTLSLAFLIQLTLIRPAFSVFEKVSDEAFIPYRDTEALVSEEPQLSSFEQQLFDELNLARTNPQAYIGFLKEHMDSFVNDKEFKEGKIHLATIEGLAVREETLTFLEAQVPIRHKLTLSKGLTQAARDHVNDQGPKGLTGHYSSDRTAPDQRANRYGRWLQEFGENISYTPQDPRGHILGLIVDDGVKNRGHRYSVYKPAFRKVGIACGEHKVYTRMCVIVLAGGYSERPAGKPGGAVMIEEF